MFRQVATLFRGLAHDAGERFTDRHALLILEQQIRDAARAVAAARKAVAIAIAQNAQEARQHQNLRTRITDLESRAVAALNKGLEDLAREAAETIAQLEAESEVSQQALAVFEEEITRLKANVRAAEAKLRDVQRGQRLASATEAALVLFVLSFLVVPKLVDAPLRRTLYFFQAITVVLIFLTTPASYWVWRLLPLSSFAQFPWRLLVVIAPFVSVTAGTIVSGQQLAISRPTNQPTPYFLLPPPFSLIILAALIMLSSYPYIQADVRDPKPTEGPVSQAALFRFQQSSDEMTGQTDWVQRIPTWSTLAEQVVRGGEITTKVNYTALPADQSVGVYSMEMDSVHELLWVGTEKEGQAVTFFVPYYPGWTATIYQDLGPHDGNLDKEKGPVTRIGPPVDTPQISTTEVEGWMVVPIPAGSHFLELRFEDTPVRVLGRWISIISVIVVVVLLIFGRRVGLR